MVPYLTVSVNADSTMYCHSNPLDDFLKSILTPSNGFCKVNLMYREEASLKGTFRLVGF